MQRRGLGADHAPTCRGGPVLQATRLVESVAERPVLVAGLAPIS